MYDGTVNSRTLLVAFAFTSPACGPRVAMQQEDDATSSDAPSGSVGTSMDPSTGSSSTTGAPATSTTLVPESSDATSGSTGLDGTETSTGASLTSSSSGATGCDAIDILFVIDTSTNFDEVQARYLAALDGLVAEVSQTFAAQSVHAGVLSTNVWFYNGGDCDWLGDLVTNTVTTDCLPEDGPHFATSDDDLAETLSCLLDIGTQPSEEFPVTATLEALSEESQAPGACNEGFLREDAVLGIIYITNDPAHAGEDDDAHPDLATFWWHDAILALKDDDETAVAVAGLVAMEPLDCIWWQQENENLIGLIDDFGPHGLRASVCEEDWGPSLSAGVELLAQTCADWEGP
jgi:hypothetical protein